MGVGIKSTKVILHSETWHSETWRSYSDVLGVEAAGQ